MSTATLRAAAAEILNTADPFLKAARSHEVAAAWRRGEMDIGTAAPPPRPARPQRPELRRPGDMPKRSMSPQGRVALVHALAHIELVAVDLAWDIIARFGAPELPRAFFDDWVQVAAEEAAHFTALAERLAEMGSAYGDLPAHDSLWEAAEITSDDLAARLALIPLTKEARGLETTLPTCVKLRQAGDEATAAILHVIYRDEITHLAVGVRWFEYLCAQRGEPAPETYAAIVAARFNGTLKPPFNMEARGAAGMHEGYLAPWTAPVTETTGYPKKSAES